MIVMIGLNNIFNIRYNAKNKWIGQVGHTKGFVDFSNKVFAIRAFCYLIMRSYRRAGVVTYSNIIERFAPSSENDVFAYKDYVFGRLKVFPWDKVETVGNVCGLACAMAFYETHEIINPLYVESIINNFNLKFYESKNKKFVV